LPTKLKEVEASELLKKVRKIEIKTRRLSKHLFAGQYHSAFKGKGMTFSEVREYQYGDNIRDIDWNVTARFNRPYVKIYEEERELTVILMIDMSASRGFGSRQRLKQDLVTEIAAVLAFSAITNNDKIGVILFSDRVEKFIPPLKGRSHILRIIRELIEFVPSQKGTNISEALRFLTNAIRKRCTAFLISDFMSPSFYDALRIANRKHEVMALRVMDERETVLPRMGLVHLLDAETGRQVVIDSSGSDTRKEWQAWWARHEAGLADSFNRSGVDWVTARTDEDYVKPLMNFFKKR
jgi:uncharacterized protein (DUF58 family)